MCELETKGMPILLSYDQVQEIEVAPVAHEAIQRALVTMQHVKLKTRKLMFESTKGLLTERLVVRNFGEIQEVEVSLPSESDKMSVLLGELVSVLREKDFWAGCIERQGLNSFFNALPERLRVLVTDRTYIHYEVSTKNGTRIYFTWDRLMVYSNAFLHKVLCKKEFPCFSE